MEFCLTPFPQNGITFWDETDCKNFLLLHHVLYHKGLFCERPIRKQGKGSPFHNNADFLCTINGIISMLKQILLQKKVEKKTCLYKPGRYY